MLRFVLPALLFIVLLVHGSLLGLSDDEAYYWVLAQKLSFGYAYHPPAVASFIAFFQFLFGGIFGSHSSGIVRLPAALSSAMIFGMGLSWVKQLGLRSGFNALSSKDELKAAALLLSFFGFFGLSWMMVPDIPLFLGWMILFTHCWSLCFGNPTYKNYWGLCLGVILTLLSKYSGILAVFSAFLSLCIWAPRERLGLCLRFLLVGGFIGIIPSFVWNYSHEWASLLYQIRERHEGSAVSFSRYLRFWGIECVLAGPLVIGSFFKILFRFLRPTARRHREGVESYILVWTLPAAAVFCIQPLFSDFKPHWAFIVWWPVVLLLAWSVKQSEVNNLEPEKSAQRWFKFQSFYGAALGIFVLASCHFPLGGWIAQGFSRIRGVPGLPMDPRLDVTNDFYGWNELEAYIKMKGGPDYASWPVVGSRYQTAAQAKFSLSGMKVTLLPQDIKERDEWPNLHVSEALGPAWPKLTTAVLFVADNRYDSGPQFPSSHCDKLGRFETRRFSLLSRWIDVWHCVPQKS